MWLVTFAVPCRDKGTERNAAELVWLSSASSLLHLVEISQWLSCYRPSV